MAGEKKTPPPPKAKAPKTKGRTKFVLALLAIGAAMPFTLPSVLLLLGGLAPTYVAYATDDDPEKSATSSVFAMNLAGIVPFLIDLWAKGQTIGNAIGLLTNTNVWLVILIAAGVGKLVVFVVPQAIATMSSTHAETRIKALKKNLDFLKEAWGPDVATTKSVNKTLQD